MGIEMFSFQKLKILCLEVVTTHDALLSAPLIPCAVARYDINAINEKREETGQYRSFSDAYLSPFIEKKFLVSKLATQPLISETMVTQMPKIVEISYSDGKTFSGRKLEGGEFDQYQLNTEKILEKYLNDLAIRGKNNERWLRLKGQTSSGEPDDVIRETIAHHDGETIRQLLKNPPSELVAWTE